MAQQQPSRARRRLLKAAPALAALLGGVTTLAACSGSDSAATASVPSPHGTAARAARSGTPSALPTPVDARQATLRAADLPGGFFNEPLTSRNLPTAPSGCPAVTALWRRLAPGTSSAGFAQVELTQGPLGPYVDEAVSVRPDAASTLADATRAVAGCPALTVTEEGVAVRLALRRAGGLDDGDGSASFAATGTWAGRPMALDIQLIRSGDLVVLLTETQVAGSLDPSVVGTVVRAATARASAAD